MWQPIETAPKDGAWILVDMGEETGYAPAAVVQWDDDLQEWRDDSECSIIALKWHPLPPIE